MRCGLDVRLCFLLLHEAKFGGTRRRGVRSFGYWADDSGKSLARCSRALFALRVACACHLGGPGSLNCYPCKKGWRFLQRVFLRKCNFAEILYLVRDSGPRNPSSRPSGCGPPQPETKRSLFKFGIRSNLNLLGPVI